MNNISIILFDIDATLLDNPTQIDAPCYIRG